MMYMIRYKFKQWNRNNNYAIRPKTFQSCFCPSLDAVDPLRFDDPDAGGCGVAGCCSAGGISKLSKAACKPGANSLNGFNGIPFRV